MKIGTCKAKEGKITEGRLKVASSHKQDIYIPVRIAQGKESGPSIFVCGGQHGNEINGIAMVHKFTEEIEIDKLNGTVIILPVLNISGFQSKQREIQYDMRDLNRCYGINKRTISYRIANTILDEVVSKCVFGIDCHDSGERASLLPHSRVHKYEKTGCTKEMGALFGTEIIMERRGREGMLAVAATKKYGVPVLTSEIGGGMIYWPKFVKQGIHGIFNILRAHHMYPGKFFLPDKQYFLEERIGYKSPFEGIAHWHVKLGKQVHKGDLLVTIYDPLRGKHSIIKSRRCGVVFQKKVQSRVMKGERCVDILQLRECRKHKTKKQQVEEIKHEKSIKKALFACKLF